MTSLPESNLCRRRKVLGTVVVSVILLLVFRLEYWTPMHSDDYFYFLKGLSLQATLHQYMHWSGRLVADFISSALLHLGSHFLTTLLNAAAVVALAFVIACMPLYALGREGARVAGGGFNATVFLLVFFLYWVSNAAIGQTSLWIVGSANYVWTNLLLCLFLLGFLSELRRFDSGPGLLQARLKMAGLCVLALIAGCSNENTSVTALALIVLLAWRQYRNGGGSARLWCYMLAFAVGAAVLLLAPGNFERYYSRGNLEWEHMSMGMRTLDHLYRRFPNAMAQYWEDFLALILLARFGPRSSRDVRYYVALFVGASFVANLVLLPAPHIPRRAMNGGLVFVLIAISFAAHGFLARIREMIPRHAIGARRARLLAGLTLVCGLYFAAVYGFMLYAYKATYVESQVRDSIIRLGIASGLSSIEIPDFHFPGLLRERHQFDRSFNGEAMARYYGTDATITQYKVRNTYSFSAPPIRR